MILEIAEEPRTRLRGRMAATGGLLVALNLCAWAWALAVLHGHPVLMGTALLAYSFGLRHAVDADHIAAIDNVTRKMMQEGKRPVAIGLFFSLGHSTVVLALTLIVVATTAALADHFEDIKAAGGVISTSVSAFFLFAIAAANLVILIGTWRSFQRAKRGEDVGDEDFTLLLAGGGMSARLFRRLFRLIGSSWHMYGLGILFGLGFETATEVGLLGISASGASNGLSPWSIMVFPALFSAGMALVDTADGMLMLGAYGWAFVKPMRKLYYNLTITFLSVMVAVLIGGIETLGLIGHQLGLSGRFWGLFAAATENFDVLGYGIILVFAAGWVASLLLYKLKGYDRLEMP